jgi:hypothetical protein
LVLCLVELAGVVLVFRAKVATSTSRAGGSPSLP